jgi:hypothetical protein
MENNGDMILNKKNYLQIEFDKKSIRQIYILFINVVFEYLKSFKSIIDTKHKKYSVAVIKRGISMLKNVMNVLFVYTRNMDMIYKHLNKSFLYYIEFIEQIGEEGNTFLQLSSKDAVLFVYKKTLFEINTDYKKNMEYTKEERGVINTILDTLNMFIFITEYVLFENKDSLEDINSSFIHKKINKIIERYIKKIHIQNLNVMTSDLFYHLVLNDVPINTILSTLDTFLHKIKLSNKHVFNENLIKTPVKKDLHSTKYVNLLLNKI